MATELGNVDPFEYTVEQTIQALSPHLTESHAESLRLNEVTGRVLLQTASYETLKSDLDIVPLGRRARIIETVSELKKRSAAYQEYQLQLAINTVLPQTQREDEELLIAPMYLPATPIGRQRRIHKNHLSPVLNFSDRSALLPETKPLELWNRVEPLHIYSPFAGESTASWIDAGGTLRSSGISSEKHQETENTRPKRIAPVTIDTITPEQAKEFGSPSPTYHDVPEFQDRIVPSTPEVPSASNGVLPTGTYSLEGPVISNIAPIEITPVDNLSNGGVDMSISKSDTTLPEEYSGTRRIVPTMIGPVRSLGDTVGISELDPEPEVLYRRKGFLTKRYLPSKGKKIESLFYNVVVGDEIPLEFDDDEFSLVTHSKNFPGEQHYVSRRIGRFLKDNGHIIADYGIGFATNSASGQLVRTIHRGCPRIAVKHYNRPERYLRKYEHQSFTVFDVEPKGVRAHRESTRTLNLPWAVSPMIPVSSTSETQIVRHADKPLIPQLQPNINNNTINDWDYLLKWQNIDGADDELPPFGESGDEGEYDERTWREIEEEFGSKEKVFGGTRSRVYLTKKEVESTINDGIVEVVQKWKEKEIAKKEATAAYRLWRCAKRTKTRKKNIKVALNSIKTLSERLEKMKTEFLKNGMNWSKKDQVRKQVKGSMGLTITEREELRWIVELMKRKEEPAKPIRNTLKTIDIDGDERVESDAEESIESDSDEDLDSEEDENEMQDFIIGDPVTINQQAVIETSQGDDDDVEMEPDGDIEMRDVSSESELDLGYRTPGADIKAEYSTPVVPTGSNYIDLTGDSPPRPKVRVIDLSDDEYEEPQHPVKRPKGNRYNLLRELVTDNMDMIMQETIFFRLRDLKGDLYKAWFDRTLEALKNLHLDHARLWTFGKHEEKITRAICRLYIAWKFHRKNAGGYDRVSAQELIQLKGLKTFEAFTNDLHAILQGSRDVLGDEPEPAGNSRFLRRPDDPDVQSADYEFDELDDEPNESQHRKRKRKMVIEDQRARAARDRLQKTHKNIRRRIAEQEKRAREKGEEIAGGKLLVNRGHYANEREILISPDIADKLKQHQVDGVRFLWQQLIQGHQGQKREIQDGQKRGALLAHTMGLGKTFQVITFLYTLAEAGASPDKMVYNQIPEHLRKSKTLILSPPGLIDNWWDEFHNWLPFDENSELSEKYIGKIYRADSLVREIKVGALYQWNANGGILLISYQMFRGFFFNKPGLRGAYLSEEEHAATKKILLDGPNIIVADEAHQLKNSNALITQAASQFTSRCRIAMTGSPLSNNLMEYWSMIEWIHPGYLGLATEFKRKYVEPIEDGLYSDSSGVERRQSLKMLQVLKLDLSLHINRADIDVIKDEMPPKTEFLITVSLTPLQIEFYQRFIRDTTTVGAAEVGMHRKTFFDIVSLMGLICSHPDIFVKAIEEQQKSKQNKTRKGNKLLVDAEADLNEDITEEIDVAPVNDLLSTVNKPYDWAQTLLLSSQGNNLEHSNKLLAFSDILRFSVDEGDKVLVFSHSIPTLDVLERTVRSLNLKYFRLDGKTPMVDRQRSAKLFNTGESDVFLISTEAGGLGLNLPGANRVVIFDFKWSPMWEHQAVGRAYRLGQKKHVFVYRFRSGGTFEDNMWNTAQFKSQLQRRVVDQKAPVREAHKKRQQYLAPPRMVDKPDLTSFKGKDHVLDRIMADKGQFSGYICGIEYTETFQPDTDDALTEEEKKEADELLQEAVTARERERVEKNMVKADHRPAIPPTTLVSTSPGVPGNIGVPSSSSSLRWMPYASTTPLGTPGIPPPSAPVLHRTNSASSNPKALHDSVRNHRRQSLPLTSNVADSSAAPPSTQLEQSRIVALRLGPETARQAMQRIEELNNSVKKPQSVPPNKLPEDPRNKFGLNLKKAGVRLPTVFKGRKNSNSHERGG